MRVGKRLDKILSLINFDASVVADIGTDHGILAFKILTEHKATRVIATDISEPSLHKAIEIKNKYNLGENYVCLVGDGFKPLEKESQIDIVVVAGMGGNEIVKILKEKPERLNIKKYIFQPMQDVMVLREYLIGNGYEIIIDETVKDRGKFYSTIMCEYVGGKNQVGVEEVVVGKTDRFLRGMDFIEWLNTEISKQQQREEYLNDEKKQILDALKKIKLENEEKNKI